MASAILNCQSNLFSHDTHLPNHPQISRNMVFLMVSSRISNTQIPFFPKKSQNHSLIGTNSPSKVLREKSLVFGKFLLMGSTGHGRVTPRTVRVEATITEKPKKRYPGEAKGFVEEMRFVAMKLHTRDQSKEGEKESDAPPIGKWEPTVEGYIRFLVDSKLVYDTLERIVEKAAFPSYSEFRNTGLERSEKLAKDLEWFKEQGYIIPEPSSPGTSYATYLEELSEKDPQAFSCHFYNVYFAHTAGGRMIGKKVSEKILDNKELEFYKWDGELSELLRNVKGKLNKVAESWSREEKDHCLEETEKSFKYSGEILRLILS